MSIKMCQVCMKVSGIPLPSAEHCRENFDKDGNTDHAYAGHTELRCHCGMLRNGTDHCIACGCEEYERTCSHRHMPLPDLPLPGMRIHSSVVIASVWMNDEGHTPSALTLNLVDEPPYYRVREISWYGTGWQVDVETTHPNIVPAVREYEDRGGDY